MAVGMEQRETQREWCARDIAAAHVQQPGDRIGGGDQRDVGVLGHQDRGNASALALAGLTCELDGMRQHGRERRRRPSVPHRIDGVGFDRHETAAGAQAGTGEAIVAVDGLQPGIEAELATLGQILGDPLFGRLFRNLVRREGRKIDLIADGQSVAPVNEDSGAVGQHDGKARRAAETGQPAQPLRAAWHILALMLVRPGHDEPIEAALLQLGAEIGQARGRGRARLKPVVGGGKLCPPHRQRFGQFGISRRVDQFGPLRPGQAFGGSGDTPHQRVERGRVGGEAALAEEGDDDV